jgi:hypothetical protein
LAASGTADEEGAQSMADLAELTDFIVRMSQNPEQARRFREDPNAIIAESGLSEESKRLLTSGPREFMRDVFATERRARRFFGAPTLVIPVTQSNVQTNAQQNVETTAHVSTDANNQVTPHVLVAIEYEYE